MHGSDAPLSSAGGAAAGFSHLAGMHMQDSLHKLNSPQCSSHGGGAAMTPAAHTILPGREPHGFMHPNQVVMQTTNTASSSSNMHQGHMPASQPMVSLHDDSLALSSGPLMAMVIPEEAHVPYNSTHSVHGTPWATSSTARTGSAAAGRLSLDNRGPLGRVSVQRVNNPSVQAPTGALNAAASAAEDMGDGAVREGGKVSRQERM